MPLQPEPQQLHEEVAIKVDVEHHGVVVGLVGEEDCQRGKHSRGDALSEPDGPHAVSRHTVACIVEDVIDDEHQHGHDDRDAQSALADDGAERSADKEEYEARKRQGELVDGLDVVDADQPVGVGCDQRLELQVAQSRLRCLHGLCHGALLVLGRQAAEHGVDVERLRARHLHGPDRVAFLNRHTVEIGALDVRVVLMTDAVELMMQRIHVVTQAVQALAARIVCQRTGICQAEVSVEVEHNLLVHESLAPIRNGRAAGHVLATHVLEPLAVVECQHQVLLLRRRLYHARVGQDDGSILVTARQPVDHHAVEHTRAHVLLLNVQARLRYAIVEDAFGNLHLRTFLLHGE